MRVSFSKHIFLKTPNSLIRHAFARNSSGSTLAEDVTYPPIKPIYPEGLWGKIPPKKAWQMTEVRENLMAKPTAKWRLEEMAGKLPGKIMWLVNPVDPQPGTLPYKQYITKTHIEKDLPNLYKNSETQQEDLLQKLVNRVRSQVEDVIRLEEDLVLKERAAYSLRYDRFSNTYYQQRITRQIVDVLINNASYDVPHLLEVQVELCIYVDAH